MATFAAAALEGFRAGTEIKDTIVADIDLKQATQEATAEGKGADLFTTYQKAGQMAMQSGNTRVADKFLKQANEYKGDALKLKLDEMKVHHAEVSDFERTIRANDNPDSLKAAISSSDKLNPQEKLEYTGLVDKAQKSGKWDEFHKAIGQSTETYKEQQATQIAILKEQLAEQKVLFDMNYKSEKLRIDAGKSAGKGVGKPTQEQKDETKLQDKLDAVDTRLETEIAGIEGKDPRKFDATEKARQITEAKNRAQSRKQQLQKRSTAKKPETNKAKVPAYSDWLKAAKEKNPGVSDADLKAYYEKTYKE